MKIFIALLAATTLALITCNTGLAGNYNTQYGFGSGCGGGWKNSRPNCGHRCGGHNCGSQYGWKGLGLGKHLGFWKHHGYYGHLGPHGPGMHHNFHHVPMLPPPPCNAGPPSPAVTYPYYTTRGPRDFLLSDPPSIGP